MYAIEIQLFHEKKMGPEKKSDAMQNRPSGRLFVLLISFNMRLFGI